MRRKVGTGIALLTLAALGVWLVRRGRMRGTRPERPAEAAGERRLDEALMETFPASDPIAVAIE